MIEFDWAIIAIMLILLSCVFSCWWCTADSNNERMSRIHYINEVEENNTYTSPTGFSTPRRFRSDFGSKKNKMTQQRQKVSKDAKMYNLQEEELTDFGSSVH